MTWQTKFMNLKSITIVNIITKRILRTYLHCTNLNIFNRSILHNIRSIALLVRRVQSFDKYNKLTTGFIDSADNLALYVINKSRTKERKSRKEEQVPFFYNLL